MTELHRLVSRINHAGEFLIGCNVYPVITPMDQPNEMQTQISAPGRHLHPSAHLVALSVYVPSEENFPA